MRRRTPTKIAALVLRSAIAAIVRELRSADDLTSQLARDADLLRPP
jgi:hypothetical protein